MHTHMHVCTCHEEGVAAREPMYEVGRLGQVAVISGMVGEDDDHCKDEDCDEEEEDRHEDEELPTQHTYILYGDEYMSGCVSE